MCDEPARTATSGENGSITIARIHPFLRIRNALGGTEQAFMSVMKSRGSVARRSTSAKGARTMGARVRFGPAGWMYKDWEGIVYPRPKPRHFDQLRYIAEFFDTV